MIKDHGLYTAFKYSVGDLVGRPLKKAEVEKTLDYFINGRSAKDCADSIKRASLL